MCRLARCACFVLLVALFVFGCSGFRIDSPEMGMSMGTSLSATSSSSSTSPFSSSLLLERLFESPRQRRHLDAASAKDGLPPSRRRGRTRQRSEALHNPNGHGQRRMASTGPRSGRLTSPTGHIETTVLSPPGSDRIQRQRRRDAKRRAYHCQRQDVARKAYLANTVVRAKAESMSSDRAHNYSVTFRILERYKTAPVPIDDTLRLTFSSDTKDMHCEQEGRARNPARDRLVKAKIEQSKEYFLFLDSHGMHNYSVVGMPVLKKKRNNGKKNRDLEVIKRITSKNFVPKAPKSKINANLTDHLKPGKKLRLICTVRGFPVPYVSWKKDKNSLHPSKRTRITYNKRKTTLVINSVQAEDQGAYQCIAKGVNGAVVKDEVTIQISNSDECKDEQFKEFCLNGGTCVRIMHGEIGCQCPEGFTGERCGEKDVSNHSSMYGHNTFSCKLGLSTTYYC